MNFEIKKSEVIASVVIIAVMMIFGFSISSKIRYSLLEKYQEYDSAIKIDSNKELFEHGMQTDIGNAFVYGNLKALDPVSYPEVDGEYSYIKKEKQEYRMHERTEYYTDSDGNRKSRKVEYWSWDTIWTETKTSTRISFLDVEFEYKKIPFPSSRQIDIISTGFNRRNVYYAKNIEYQGTIYTSLKNNTVNDTNFYANRTIKESVESLETGWQLVVFWILWLFLTGGIVVFFYYKENWWLD